MTPNGMAIMLCVAPMDMRASFDGLARAVTERLKVDAKAEQAMYVFVNRRRDMAKVLWRDRTGWCLLAKRLEGRLIAVPAADGSAGHSLLVDAKTLAFLLDGVERRRPTNRDIAREARLAVDSRHISLSRGVDA